MSYCRKPGNELIAEKKNKTETDSYKLRKCLAPGCGEMFPSQWAGERICPTCKRGERYRDGGNPFEENVTFGHH